MLAMTLKQTRGDMRIATGVLCALGAIIAAALSGSSDQGAALALTAAQTLGLVLLFRLGYSERRRWATPTCITAAAWSALFLIPAWVYAIDPSRLAFVKHPAPGIALTDLSLFALIAGLVLARPPQGAEPERRLIAVERTALERRWIIGWTVLGLLCLVAFFASAGGPVYYLRHLNNSASLTAGLFYLVWGTLALKFLVLTGTVRNWAEGRGVSRRLLGAWLGVLIVLGATGNRSFIAIALVEAVVAFSLVRRPLPTGRLAIWTVVGVFVLVFGLGTIKRYQSYSSANPHPVSFGSYVIHRAPREAIQAYVGNYVDTQELISLARAVVPRYAHYEHGLVLLELLLKPIPHQLRPVLHRQAAIRQTFYPTQGSSYAIPLPAIAYLQFGIPGIVFAFLLVGAALARVDHALCAERRSLSTLLTLIAAATMIPFVLRSGLPDGLTVAVIEVLGVFAVARLSRTRSGVAEPA
jgi:hypothetical protein